MHPEDAKRIYNPEWRLLHLPKIQTKDGRKVTLAEVVNPPQRDIIKHLPLWHRFLILKARQIGCSTLFLLWHLLETLFHENITTGIIAHRRDSLKTLFRIIKIAYDTIPPAIQLADGRVWRKPVAKYDNVNELQFEGIDSRIYVALEVRSDRLNRLHISEAHFIKNAPQVLAATISAVVPGGVISQESTANGVGGPFYDAWEEAEQGQNDYLSLFYGFHTMPEYRLPADGFVPDDEERWYLDNVEGMTPEALMWRRMMLKQPGMRNLFKQEFPATAEEAFLTSGRTPFDREKILDWIIREPIETKMEGRMLTWVKPAEGKRYILGLDSSSGRGIETLDKEEKAGDTDYNVFQVWDCETMQLCKAFRGKWPYAKQHEILYQLGTEYNNAYVVVEAEAHGLTVINNFVRDYVDTGLYHRSLVHTTEYVDTKSKKPQRKWGWVTSAKTKPLILDRLAEVIEEEEIRCHWKMLQREALRFEIKDDGSMAAMDGFTDDAVMCAAICIYNIPHALKAGRRAVSKAELGLSGM